MNPRLRVIAGPLKDQVIELPAGEISIGRVATNQIAISDPALSRQHCVIAREGDQFKIRDLQSRNGTQVNGAGITEQWLRHGDRIGVGDSLLLFLTQEEDPEPAGAIEYDEEVLSTQATVHLRPEDALYLHPPVTEEDSISAALSRKLNALLKISQSVHSIHDLRELQEQVLQSVFEVCPAELGAILLDRHGEITSSLARDRQGSQAQIKVSRTVVQQVMKQGVGLLINDVPNQVEYGGVQSLVASKIRSLLCAPLNVMNRATGCIYVAMRASSVPFTEDHLHLVTALAAIASVALENVNQLDWLRQENRRLITEINLDHNIVGDSGPIRDVLQVLSRVAPTETTVLIRGESGTGKELAARAIHNNSRRSEKPFVAINCAAITETLLESELFGHEKGAFTGSYALKKGKIECANGGTVFLDEIGELPPGLQAKLLRVLQERELERVGGTRQIPVDIRVLAATNRNLEEAMKSGLFRQDLYFRLNVVALTMPPLRDHKQDIPQLAAYFVEKHSNRSSRPVKTIAEPARTCLMSYDWPGNVRELENAIERAVVLSVGDTLLLEDLPEQILDLNPSPDYSSAKYHGAVQDLKKKLILSAVKESNGNYTDAAKALGLHPNYLHRLIRNLNLKSSI